MPGATPSIGDKLDAIYCALLEYLQGGGGGGGTSGVQVFADAAARNAAAPDFVGQWGYQEDTQAYFTAVNTGAGGWSGQVFLGGGDAGDAGSGKLVLYGENSTFFGVLIPDTLSATRVWTLPDTDGTIDVTP